LPHVSSACFSKIGTPLTLVNNKNTKTGDTRLTHWTPVKAGKAINAIPDHKTISPK
jgi:hypothetical protein